MKVAGLPFLQLFYGKLPVYKNYGDKAFGGVDYATNFIKNGRLQVQSPVKVLCEARFKADYSAAKTLSIFERRRPAIGSVNALSVHISETNALPLPSFI